MSLRTPTLALALMLLVTPATQAADFNDLDYHEVVLFEWDSTHLDVLILPPVAPHAVWRIEAIEQAVDAWEAGLDSDSDLDGVDIVRYTVGVDTVPPAGFQVNDPDIIVALSTEPGAVGIGIPTDFFVCDIVDQFLSTPDSVALPGLPAAPLAAPHSDSVWSILSTSECRDNTGNTCLVVSTNWETVQSGRYDLVAHEFGHCLGIGHVGDANDFSTLVFPSEDIMSYQATPSQVHCYSSLNELALKVSFSDVLGITPPATTMFEGFPYVEQTTGSYTQDNCSNPPVAPLDIDWFPLE